MEFSGFISDGYTRPGYIAALERQHPALRFKYRPVLQANRAVILKEIDRLMAIDPAKAEGLATRTIFMQVKEWDLKDDKGNPVSLSVENIAKVEPNLQNRLYNIVMGMVRSLDGQSFCDEDPEWNKEQQEAASMSIEAALSGKGLAFDEATDAKNSVPATNS